MQHSQSSLGHNHKFINWEFETEAEWQAYNGITAADFHKVAYVKELQKYYSPIAVDSGTGAVTWITPGGGASGVTNLGYTPAAGQGTVTSDTGTDAVIPAATNLFAGLFLPAEKDKLTLIAAGAEVNVNADWNAVSGDAQILNKPTLGTAASQDSSAFATAAQGAKADTAVQPATLNTRLGTTGNLGTLAQQDANAIAVTGGSASGLSAVGVSGDITYALGAGRKLLAPMGYGTVSSNFLIQSVAVDTNSIFNIAPNGTAQIAGFNVFNSSDLTNGVYMSVSCRAAESRFSSGALGAGIAVPMTFQVNGEAVRIHTTRNVSIGSTTDNGFKLEITGSFKATTVVFSAFTVATVPSAAANTNAGIIVTNAASGRRPYWSNGTDWRDAANVILS